MTYRVTEKKEFVMSSSVHIVRIVGSDVREDQLLHYTVYESL